MIGTREDLAPIAQTDLEGSAAVLDVAHLSRQTFGDRDVEREVLTLFQRLSVTQFVRLTEAASAAERREIAHALLGSALGIGAMAVAERARAIEQAEDPGPTLIDALGAAIHEARRFISERLET